MDYCRETFVGSAEGVCTFVGAFVGACPPLFWAPRWCSFDVGVLDTTTSLSAYLAAAVDRESVWGKIWALIQSCKVFKRRYMYERFASPSLGNVFWLDGVGIAVR